MLVARDYGTNHTLSFLPLCCLSTFITASYLYLMSGIHSPVGVSLSLILKTFVHVSSLADYRYRYIDAFTIIHKYPCIPNECKSMQLNGSVLYFQLENSLHCYVRRKVF